MPRAQAPGLGRAQAYTQHLTSAAKEAHWTNRPITQEQLLERWRKRNRWVQTELLRLINTSSR